MVWQTILTCYVGQLLVHDQSQATCVPESVHLPPSSTGLSKLETWTKLSSGREGNEWHQREVHSDPQRILWFDSAKSIGSEWLAMIGSEYRSVWPSLNLYGLTAGTPTVIVIGPVTLITIATATAIIVHQKKISTAAGQLLAPGLAYLGLFWTLGLCIIESVETLRIGSIYWTTAVLKHGNFKKSKRAEAAFSRDSSASLAPERSSLTGACTECALWFPGLNLTGLRHPYLGF